MGRSTVPCRLAILVVGFGASAATVAPGESPPGGLDL